MPQIFRKLGHAPRMRRFGKLSGRLPAVANFFGGPGQARLLRDHEFLLRGNVFTEDLIHTWIGYKQKNEVDAMALRPHPYEFCFYYDM